MTRTISTGEDVDRALDFLGNKKGMDGQAFFLQQVQQIIADNLKAADEQRFELAKSALDDKDKTGSLNKLRELLAV